MTCVKTGAHIYLEEWNSYAICDAFRFDGVWVFRISGAEIEPIRETLHFTIVKTSQWFDQNKEGKTSTLISSNVKYHGYDGINM